MVSSTRAAVSETGWEGNVKLRDRWGMAGGNNSRTLRSEPYSPNHSHESVADVEIAAPLPLAGTGEENGDGFLLILFKYIDMGVYSQILNRKEKMLQLKIAPKSSRPLLSKPGEMI